jgi:YD repeat-containing protein
VLFFPAAAEVNTVLYGLAFAKVSETDTRGITTFYSYDNLGRLTKVSDRDLNILKRYSYSFEPKVLQTQISVSTVNGPRGSSSAYVDASTILNISPYYPGAEYKIKVASMTAPELITDFNTNAIITTTPSFTYIFPQTGSWLVNVMITYQGNVYHGYYSYIEVIDTPLTVSLCSNRPGRIDLCNSIPLISSCSSSSGLVLTAAVSGGSGSYSYIWTVDGSVSSQTSSSFNALHYEVSRIYECFVKDNNNPNKTGRSRFEIQVFQSNPFCLPPSQN